MSELSSELSDCHKIWYSGYVLLEISSFPGYFQVKIDSGADSEGAEYPWKWVKSMKFEQIGDFTRKSIKFE